MLYGCVGKSDDREGGSESGRAPCDSSRSITALPEDKTRDNCLQCRMRVCLCSGRPVRVARLLGCERMVVPFGRPAVSRTVKALF